MHSPAPAASATSQPTDDSSVGKTSTLRAPKALHTIGHKLVRFVSARSICWSQFDQNKIPALTRWRKLVGKLPPKGEPGDGIFATLVVVGEQSDLRITKIFCSQDEATHLMAQWNSSANMEQHYKQALPPAAAIPSDSQAAIWLALLRSRPLQALWERELRRDNFEILKEVLPPAWILDPQPLPPGTVIPGLNCADWKQLSHRRASDASFQITHAIFDGPAQVTQLAPQTTEDIWSSAIDAALVDFDRAPKILLGEPNTPKGKPMTPVAAFYEKKGARIDHIGHMILPAS